MFKESVIRNAIQVSVLGLIAATMMIVPELSFAGGTCNGRCQMHRMCGDLVKSKGLKGDKAKAEYQKCTMNPQSYK